MTVKKDDRLVEIYNRFGEINRPTEETVFMIIELETDYNIRNTHLTLQEQYILDNQNMLKLNDSLSDELLSDKLGISVKLLQKRVKTLKVKLLIEFLRDSMEYY